MTARKPLTGSPSPCGVDQVPHEVLAAILVLGVETPGVRVLL